jgi:RimJ/RimL family protein N-acetyltransferase
MHDGNATTLRIETSRLVIRPIEPTEIADFHAIASRREVAENLASIPHPMSAESAKEWLTERAFRNTPELVAGIFRADETLVGCIGISDNPFLDWCVDQYGIREIKVGVHRENLGSIKVLEKSGFQQTHATLFQPPFRDSPDLLLMYWKGYGSPVPLTIKTEKLFIHPVHPGHANRLIELEDESEKFQVLGAIDPRFASENTTEWIRASLNQSDVDRLAITSAEGLLTGACEISVDNRIGEIKMWVGSIHWSKSYCSDAVRGLVRLIFDRVPEVATIVTNVTHDNETINQIMRSIGFIEGPERGATAKLSLYKGKFID